MTVEEILAEIDQGGFGWYADRGNLLKVVDALNAECPPDWSETFREKAIGDFLCVEATKRGWNAGKHQSAFMRDFLIRALVRWRVQ